MKTCFQFYLSGFPGCYNSFLSLDYDGEVSREMIKNYLYNLDLPSSDSFGFEYFAKYNLDEWEKTIMHYYEEKVRSIMQESGINPLAFSVTGFQRPREYNFMNDRLEVEWSPSKKDYEKVLSICKAHRDEFQKYVRERWSSRDGFISFMPDDSKDYLDVPLEGQRQRDNMAGELLYFALNQGKWKIQDIEFWFMEDVSQWDYIDLERVFDVLDAYKEQIKEWLEKGEGDQIYHRLHDEMVNEG